MRPLKDVLPANADKVMYVFYESRIHKISCILARQMHMSLNSSSCKICARCEDVEDGVDCERFGSRRHSFWEDPVGDLLNYLCEPRPWDNKIVAIAHNTKAFDLHFILNRVIMLKWKPELITNGLKIISMKMEHLVFWTACPSSRVHCVNWPRISVCRPLNHGTPTTLTLRKTSIM